MIADKPLAYHITFGTYGTRLHGDSRGTVDREHNQYGEPVIGKNDLWLREETASLKFPAVRLTDVQRVEVEILISKVCDRGGWTLLVCAAREDHVHTLLTTNSDGQVVRRLLKRWLSEALSGESRRAGGWWAECGSVKWVWTEDYRERAYLYVREQRTTRT